MVMVIQLILKKEPILYIHITLVSSPPACPSQGYVLASLLVKIFREKKNQTKTERTSHQNQLKWEEMQSPKYLSYLDLGLLTNLHWDVVTHCST